MEIKKVLKPEGGFRKSGLYKGWIEYNEEVSRVFSYFQDMGEITPYWALRELARLISQVPNKDYRDPHFPDAWFAQDEYCTEYSQVALELIDTAEQIGTPAAHAACLKHIAYPTQATPGCTRSDIEKMKLHPDWRCFSIGYAWDWIPAQE